MRTFRTVIIISLLAVVLSAAACATQSASHGDNKGSDRTQAEPLTGSAKDFERARFENSAHIDNAWLRFKPGTQFVYEGSAIAEDEGRLSRRVVTTVSDLTKDIGGVTVLVVSEKDYTAGQLSEPELAFFAQDDAGNVWLIGEYPEEYEHGEFDKAPAWINGQKGATAGIAMPADPQVGTPDYAQGYAPPPVDFTDRAEVYKTDQQTCVPVDCYGNVVVTEEFNPDEPDAYQLKYYAPGVGNVRVGWRGKKEEEKETLKLTEYRQLSPEALAKVRKDAMEMDQRAYERSEAYQETQPVERTLQAGN